MLQRLAIALLFTRNALGRRDMHVQGSDNRLSIATVFMIPFSDACNDRACKAGHGKKFLSGRN